MEHGFTSNNWSGTSPLSGRLVWPAAGACINGAGIDRVNRWLKGEDDIPVYVQRDFYVWSKDEAALDWAIRWADEHAQDVRAVDR